MIEQYGEFIETGISWPERTTEEQKMMIREMVKRRSIELTSISVVYTPSCGCEIELDVILDRFPMSEKIHHICPNCHKGILAEITNPIEFWEPLNKQKFYLEDLKTMEIQESHQSHLLNLYKYMAKNVYS